MIEFAIQNIPADVTRDFRGRPLLTFFGTSGNYSVFIFPSATSISPLAGAVQRGGEGEGQFTMKAAIKIL